MPTPVEEARAHVAAAEKALKPSWMSLKFSPDNLTASMEYGQAATKFRSAGLLQEAVDAWVKSAVAKEEMADVFGAARAYESAAGICDGSGPGGPDAAAAHWEQAVRCFRLNGKGELAAKLLMKLAAYREKKGDTEGTKQAYQDAIDIFEQDEKDYNLADVYKQYTGYLVRNGAFEDALAAIDGHIKVLRRQGHHPFVNQELLCKVVIHLHAQDTVRAQDALAPAGSAEGWFMSKECTVGSSLVLAFESNDAEAVAALLKDHVFANLQVEVARLARQLKVPTLPTKGGAGIAAAPSGHLADALI